MGMPLETAKHEVAAGFMKSSSLLHQRSSWNGGTPCKYECGVTRALQSSQL